LIEVWTWSIAFILRFRVAYLSWCSYLTIDIQTEPFGSWVVWQTDRQHNE